MPRLKKAAPSKNAMIMSNMAQGSSVMNNGNFGASEATTAETMFGTLAPSPAHQPPTSPSYGSPPPTTTSP